MTFDNTQAISPARFDDFLKMIVNSVIAGEKSCQKNDRCGLRCGRKVYTTTQMFQLKKCNTKNLSINSKEVLFWQK